MKLCTATNIVDWHEVTPEGHTETVKWRVANSSHGIHQVILEEIEPLKECHAVLHGCKELHIHADHKNPMFHKFNTQ